MSICGKNACKKCEYKDRCANSDARQQTNEEWLRQASTEQLADVLFDYRYVNATPQQQLWLSANEDFVKGGIVEWLKQPHREESKK